MKLYSYGFNGMRKDHELKGDDNSYDFGARMYDPRIGKFFSKDPKTRNYPWQSPYLFAGNSPIINIDVNGEYSVATHYIMTYNAAIAVGYSEAFAKNLAHYASVYADHPDWKFAGGLMRVLNNEEMKAAGFNPKELDYDEEAHGDYSKLETSQGSSEVSSVSIHAMKTFWEGISDDEAVTRALEGGTFKSQDGKKDIVIEGANNVLRRLEGKGEDMTIDEMKEMGVALHTIQDAEVHKGARWVTKEDKKAAKSLHNHNDHPNIGCVVAKTGLKVAENKTLMHLLRQKISGLKEEASKAVKKI